jgi:hypothetical protein
MTDKPREYGQEVRETVLKSSLTGVAATVLAVTVFSPAGFGGMVGTSLASGFGLDPNAASADDPYASLPPYPAPLSAEELSDIHNRLATTTASLEITRAATDAKIEFIRSIALSGDAVTFAPMPQTARVNEGLRLRTSEPEAFAAAAPSPAPIADAPAPTPVADVSLTPAEAVVMPASYAGGADPIYRDPHLELADLLLAYETY